LSLRVKSLPKKEKKKETKTKIKQPQHHHMLFERVSRKILLAQSKTNSSTFSSQTRLELGTGLKLWSDETNKQTKQKNLKKSYLGKRRLQRI